jgi:hypothetical protein
VPTELHLPRLIVVSDTSLSGRWVSRARETHGVDSHLPGISNVAVQASCGDKELAYQHANAGGSFTNVFCSYAQHGNSWRTMPDPKILQQVVISRRFSHRFHGFVLVTALAASCTSAA